MLHALLDKAAQWFEDQPKNADTNACKQCLLGLRKDGGDSWRSPLQKVDYQMLTCIKTRCPENTALGHLIGPVVLDFNDFKSTQSTVEMYCGTGSQSQTWNLLKLVASMHDGPPSQWQGDKTLQWVLPQFERSWKSDCELQFSWSPPTSGSVPPAPANTPTPTRNPSPTISPINSAVQTASPTMSPNSAMQTPSATISPNSAMQTTPSTARTASASASASASPPTPRTTTSAVKEEVEEVPFPHLPRSLKDVYQKHVDAFLLSLDLSNAVLSTSVRKEIVKRNNAFAHELALQVFRLNNAEVGYWTKYGPTSDERETQFTRKFKPMRSRYVRLHQETAAIGLPKERSYSQSKDTIYNRVNSNTAQTKATIALALPVSIPDPTESTAGTYVHLRKSGIVRVTTGRQDPLAVMLIHFPTGNQIAWKRRGQEIKEFPRGVLYASDQLLSELQVKQLKKFGQQCLAKSRAAAETKPSASQLLSESPNQMKPTHTAGTVTVHATLYTTADSKLQQNLSSTSVIGTFAAKRIAAEHKNMLADHAASDNSMAVANASATFSSWAKNAMDDDTDTNEDDDDEWLDEEASNVLSPTPVPAPAPTPVPAPVPAPAPIPVSPRTPKARWLAQMEMPLSLPNAPADNANATVSTENAVNDDEINSATNSAANDEDSQMSTDYDDDSQMAEYDDEATANANATVYTKNAAVSTENATTTASAENAKTTDSDDETTEFAVGQKVRVGDFRGTPPVLKWRTPPGFVTTVGPLTVSFSEDFNPMLHKAFGFDKVIIWVDDEDGDSNDDAQIEVEETQTTQLQNEQQQHLLRIIGSPGTPENQVSLVHQKLAFSEAQLPETGFLRSTMLVPQKLAFSEAQLPAIRAFQLDVCVALVALAREEATPQRRALLTLGNTSTSMASTSASSMTNDAEQPGKGKLCTECHQQQQPETSQETIQPETSQASNPGRPCQTPKASL